MIDLIAVHVAQEGNSIFLVTPLFYCMSDISTLYHILTHAHINELKYGCYRVVQSVNCVVRRKKKCSLLKKLWCPLFSVFIF